MHWKNYIDRYIQSEFQIQIKKVRLLTEFSIGNFWIMVSFKVFLNCKKVFFLKNAEPIN